MSAADGHRLLRRLPSVDDLLRSPAATQLLARHPRWAVVAAARQELEASRRALLEGMRSGGRSDSDDEAPAIEPARLASRVADLVRPSLRRVINATGVVLHTNLGRAPLAPRALERVVEVARRYSTLEYDPAERERGSRHDHVAALLRALTGAEAAAVVNNNAGAVLVSLAALAAGRRVLVSRGELIEIGGGFRIPEVMAASGAALHEVGTTNKTRIGDYAAALSSETALLLKVHRSNFAMVGFTEETSVAALVELGRARGVPVMVDLGSGALIDTRRLGLQAEPTATEVIAEGAELCVFSGDKLLGGPQAGIVVGCREAVARVRAHPLMRALRPDKMTLAALEATLEVYREGNATEQLPALRMIGAGASELQSRAEHLVARLAELAPGVRTAVHALRSAVGGGALPLAEPETRAVALEVAGRTADALAQALAAGEPPIVARIADGRVLLDVRTMHDDEIEETAARIAQEATGSPP